MHRRAAKWFHQTASARRLDIHDMLGTNFRAQSSRHLQFAPAISNYLRHHELPRSPAALGKENEAEKHYDENQRSTNRINSPLCPPNRPQRRSTAKKTRSVDLSHRLRTHWFIATNLPSIFYILFLFQSRCLWNWLKAFFINSQVFWILCGNFAKFRKARFTLSVTSWITWSNRSKLTFRQHSGKRFFQKKFLLTLFKALWSSSKLLKAPRSSSKLFKALRTAMLDCQTLKLINRSIQFSVPDESAAMYHWSRANY